MMMEMRDKPQGPLCHLCPLRDRLHTFVPPQLPRGKAKVVIVGEAPGVNEATERKPFVGASGRLLNSMLTNVGVRRDETFITNVLHCQPLGNKLPDTDTALDKALSCCKPILDKELESQDAKVVLALGGTALRAFTGFKSGITSKRGAVYEVEGRAVIATVHPAALLRQSFMPINDVVKMVPREVVEADIKKAVTLTDKVGRGEEWRVEEEFVYNPPEYEVEEWLEEIKAKEASIAFDLETTRAQPGEAVPIIVSFASTSQPSPVLCFSFDERLESIVEVLESPAPKICHNAIFDVAVLKSIGIETANYTFDTLYAHHLLYAELSHRLGFVQSIYTVTSEHKSMLKDEMLESLDK